MTFNATLQQNKLHLYCVSFSILRPNYRIWKELEIFTKADDPNIAEILAFVKIPRTRNVQPENKIVVEKINGVGASASEYQSILAELGFVRDRGRMVLW